MSLIPISIPSKVLAQTISSTATSFKLNNIEGWNGVNLTPADFGTEAYAVFTNSTRTQIEIFKFDPATIASSSITILARGLPYNGGDTPDLARQYAWTSNDTTVQLGTDAPQLFRDFVSEVNTATITAVHTYNTLPESAVVPTTADQFVNKAYVDGKTGPSVGDLVTQAAHGFVVGDVIRVSGINTYAKAQANSVANAEVAGIVTDVIDANNFEFTVEGILTVGVPAEAAGTVLFLSPTTAGALTATEPTTIGHVSVPLATVVQNATKMVFHKYRGALLNTIAGNPIASETVAGIVEQATAAQVLAKTDVGETGAPLFVVPSLIPGATFDGVTRKILDGTPVPQAVMLLGDNLLYATDPANYPGMFQGFITADSNITAANEFKFLSGAHSTSESYAPTIPAGNKRVIIIITRSYQTSTTYSSVTVDGNPATLIGSEVANSTYNIRTTYWRYVYGDSAVPQNPTVILSGRSGGFGGHTLMTFQGVSQSSPTANYQSQITTGAGNPRTYTYQLATQPNSIVVFAMTAGGNSISSLTANPYTPTIVDSTDVSGAYGRIGYIDPHSGQDTAFVLSGTGNLTDTIQSAFRLVPDVTASNPLTVQYSGLLAGFSGLTPGAYYFAVGAGAISTTPIAGSPAVGFAASATQLMVIRPRQRFIGTATATGRVTCGFRPSIIRVFSGYNSTGTTGLDYVSYGYWQNGRYREAWTTGNSGVGEGGVDTDRVGRVAGGSAVTIGSVDNTGFTLTLGSTGYVSFEAEE